MDTNLLLRPSYEFICGRVVLMLIVGYIASCIVVNLRLMILYSSQRGGDVLLAIFISISIFIAITTVRDW